LADLKDQYRGSKQRRVKHQRYKQAAKSQRAPAQVQELTVKKRRSLFPQRKRRKSSRMLSSNNRQPGKETKKAFLRERESSKI